MVYTLYYFLTAKANQQESHYAKDKNELMKIETIKESKISYCMLTEVVLLQSSNLNSYLLTIFDFYI